MVAQIELSTFVPLSRSNSEKKNDERKSLKNMKSRLIERKELHFRCRRVNDIMCIVAMFGLFLMILDTELRLDHVNHITINLIRPLITVSTVLLVGLVVYYHSLDVRLYAINNHIADWRVTLTIHGILIAIIEILVCAIHPFTYIHISSISSAPVNNIGLFEMMITLPSRCFIYIFSIQYTYNSFFSK